MKFRVIVDSTFYLSEEEFKTNGIKKACLNVIDKDETFKESEIDNDFIYERLDSGHKLTTSQPSPGEFFDLYEELIKEGAERIFVLTLAKPLSGTYQSALLAQSMLGKPETVHIFESSMAAFGNEMLTLELVDMINNGKSEEEIISRMNRLIDKAELIFTVENLTHLARSGRLSRAKAMIGSVLRVKPLIQMVEGKLDMYKAERTHKKVVNAIIQKITETTKNASVIHFRVLSKNSLVQARLLEETIKENFKNIKLTFNEYLGPVFSLHLGKTGYGVAWCAE